MKNITCIFLSMTILINSACSTTKPVAASISSTHDHGIEVVPVYQTKTKNRKFPFTFGISAASGGLFAMMASSKNSAGIPYSSSQMTTNRITTGGVGFGLTFLALGLGYVYNRNARSSTAWMNAKKINRPVTSKNFGSWLAAFNREGHTNYILADQNNNFQTTLLVPPQYLKDFIKQEAILQIEREKQRRIAAEKRSENFLKGVAIFIGGLILLNEISKESNGNNRNTDAKNSIKTRACSACHGSGQIVSYDDSGKGYGSMCYACSGTGEIKYVDH